MGAMPTSRIDKPRATYEDLLKVPDHKVAEIVDGELYVSPRPAAPHALAAVRYVERNPVRAKMTRVPWTYRWSSAAA